MSHEVALNPRMRLAQILDQAKRKGYQAYQDRGGSRVPYELYGGGANYSADVRNAFQGSGFKQNWSYDDDGNATNAYTYNNRAIKPDDNWYETLQQYERLYNQQQQQATPAPAPPAQTPPGNTPPPAQTPPGNTPPPGQGIATLPGFDVNPPATPRPGVDNQGFSAGPAPAPPPTPGALPVTDPTAEPKVDEYGNMVRDQRFYDFYKSPGYQFRLNEGMKGVNRRNAARGGYFGGRSLKELTRYGQDYAGKAYGDYMNRLQSVSGLGQSTTNQGALMGQYTANNIANQYNQGGQYAASGYLGQANAVNKGLGNVGQLANQYWGSNSGGNTYGSQQQAFNAGF